MQQTSCSRSTREV